MLLQDLGELPEARAHFERALEIGEKALPPDLGIWHNNLGMLLRALNQLPEARVHLERALVILTASLPEGHPHIKGVRDNFEILLREMGKD